jgi:uncharacterized protein (TIGR00730 family)
MHERKALMYELSDGFIALPGGLGTLEELLEVWTAAALGMHDKPVVVLDPAGLYAPLREQVRVLVAQRFMRPAAAELLVWTTTAAEALDAVEAELTCPTEATPNTTEIIEVADP